MILFKIASEIFSSTKGTCLYAAAWITILGLYFQKLNLIIPYLQQIA